MAKRKKPNNMQKRTTKKPKLLLAAQAFVEANQEIIAALAWAGFQHEGRGFVLVAVEKSGGLDASYIGEQDDLWPVLQPDFPEITELTQAYDPRTELVLVTSVQKYTELGIAVFDMPPPIAFVKHESSLLH